MPVDQTHDGPNPASVSLLRPAASPRILTGCLLAIFGYLPLLGGAVFLMGLLEIHQSNMAQYNGLVATLVMKEEQDKIDGDTADPQAVLAKLEAARAEDLKLLGALAEQQPICQGSKPSPGAPAAATPTSPCKELREQIAGHARQLLDTADQFISYKNNGPALTLYYQHWFDGQINKTPQMAPIFSLMVSDGHPIIGRLLRMPIEWLEMFIVIVMGMLGGLIGATKYFVDPNLPDPPPSEYLYRPAMGSALALAAFALFRAGQLVMGNENPGGAVAGATSLFLFAALGLIAGLKAKEALEYIEQRPLFRSSQ